MRWFTITVLLLASSAKAGWLTEETSPVPSLEQPDNPDRFPSLGLEYEVSDLAGTSNLQFMDKTVSTDFRVPVAPSLTVNAGFGYREIDYGFGQRVNGPTYRIGGRFYFK